MSAKQPDANRWIALRQNGTALLDQVLVSSANFLTTWIIGRFGSDGELGLFLLGSTAVITVLSVLESLVCMPYIFLAHRQSPEKLSAYTGSSLLHVMALSVLAVFVLLLVALAGGERLAAGLPNILYVISFILPFHLLRMFLRRFHLSTFDMSGLLKYDALAFVAQLSILLLAWQQDWVRGTTGFLAIGAAGILVSLLWLKQSGAAYSLTNQVTSHFSENWKFGKSVLSAQLMWVLHLHAMIWMLTYSYDKQLAGQYGACMAVVMLVNPFVLGMLNVISPRVATSFATGGNPLVRAVVWRNLGFMVVVVTAALSALLLFGDSAVQFLFGAQYAGHQSVITFLAIAMIAETACKAPEHGLQAIHKPHCVAWINLVRLVVTLLLASQLVFTRGLLGAAMTLAFADTLAAILFCVVFHYQTAQSPLTPVDLNKNTPLSNHSGTGTP